MPLVFNRFLYEQCHWYVTMSLLFCNMPFLCQFDIGIVIFLFVSPVKYGTLLILAGRKIRPSGNNKLGWFLAVYLALIVCFLGGCLV